MTQAPTQPAPPPGRTDPAQPVTAAQSRQTGIPTGLTTAAVATPPTLAGRTSQAIDTSRRALSGTPGRLRLLALAAIVTAIGFGLVAGQAFRNADAGIERAEANTEQLIRIQAINTNLMRADAQATNAFLLGGLEPAASRAAYTSAIEESTRLIAEAAQAQPADGAALARLNQLLVDYASDVETARVNNRQSLPVGAQYLREASATLRADALPILSNLLDANEQRTQQEFDAVTIQRLWLALATVAFLGVAIGGGIWLARRTHRVFNVPLTAGAVAVLLMGIGGYLVLGSVASTVTQIRSAEFAATVSSAQARIAAFDAKSQESLTLINRGSGAANEEAWQVASTTVTDRATEAESADPNPDATGLAAAWQPYVQAHEKIRELDNNGQWEQAVGYATGTEDKTSTEAFAEFDRKSADVVDQASASVRDTLSERGAALPYYGWLGLLVGLLAAIGAWWGISLRLEEYR